MVHGLAWTPTGGDLLTIEAARLPGKGNLRLTGKLGEVMQESANLALSFVRMRSDSLGLAEDFLEKVDLHVHLPEGAIPKDGPSAGITLAMALLEDLPLEVREQLTIHLVAHMDEVIRLALVRPPVPLAAMAAPEPA